ncbi:hypothetical protein ACLOJK_036019, partial [Asimina triloba]
MHGAAHVLQSSGWVAGIWTYPEFSWVFFFPSPGGDPNGSSISNTTWEKSHQSDAVKAT